MFPCVRIDVHVFLFVGIYRDKHSTNEFCLIRKRHIQITFLNFSNHAKNLASFTQNNQSKLESIFHQPRISFSNEAARKPTNNFQALPYLQYEQSERVSFRTATKLSCLSHVFISQLPTTGINPQTKLPQLLPIHLQPCCKSRFDLDIHQRRSRPLPRGPRRGGHETLGRGDGISGSIILQHYGPERWEAV